MFVDDREQDAKYKDQMKRPAQNSVVLAVFEHAHLAYYWAA